MKAAKQLVLAVALTAASSAFAAATSTVTLQVKNMVCTMCSSAVTKALLKVPGVETAQVDLNSKQAVVTFDPAKTTAQALTKATAVAGFPSIIKER